MKTNSVIYTAQPEDAGLRLDKFLARLEEISSRTYAQILIEKSLITVNNKPTKASAKISSGDIIELSLPELVSAELAPYALPLDIVFEDDDLLVVNKPSGLVVHPAAGHQHDTLVNALIHYTSQLSMKNELRPGIVHRIDKETSGLLVVAKNDFAHEALAQQFKNKTTHRIYFAVVAGKVLQIQGKCQSYLARHPVDRKKFASIKEKNKILTTAGLDIGGKWAVTHYKRLQTQNDMSYLQLQLETGRTHQIRVHMSELGHSLIGDTLYGFSVKKMKELKLTRFYLHAAELGFTHPKTSQNLLFKAPWSGEDKKVISSLGFSVE